MHILQGIKSLFQFVGDRDTFCLVRLAIGNLFKHSETKATGCSSLRKSR